LNKPGQIETETKRVSEYSRLMVFENGVLREIEYLGLRGTGDR
jgi:hypothetical protein